MFTEEFKKACEDCKTEEERKAVIKAHKVELTDEELQQVSGGFPSDVEKSELTDEEIRQVSEGRSLTDNQYL